MNWKKKQKVTALIINYFSGVGQHRTKAPECPCYTTMTLFLSLYIYIYINAYIFYHLYVKVVISYWSYLHFSVDVKDFCCLLSTHQWFHLLAHRRPRPSSRDSIYSVSGLCFSDINVLVFCVCVWVLSLHTGTRLGCVNLTSQQKPTSAGMNVLRGSFLGTLTFPPTRHPYPRPPPSLLLLPPPPLCSQLLYTRRNWLVLKLQDQVPHYLRCQESSLVSCSSKQNEKKKKTK